MEKKTQIFFVHGGMTFSNHEDYLDFLRKREISIEEKIRWRDDYLKESLGKDFHLIKPRMPLQDNAKYEEWKIHFERYFNQLTDNLILIGSSLGGIFLAKYLSENKFPKKILSVYLIGPPFENSLYGEELVGGFELKDDLSMIMKNCKNVNLFFSQDDDCVPLSHAEKYKKKLPDAKIVIYESKNGHFNIQEFPEIIKMIKADINLIRNS